MTMAILILIPILIHLLVRRIKGCGGVQDCLGTLCTTTVILMQQSNVQ
jgi:hypothetical protein